MAQKIERSAECAQVAREIKEDAALDAEDHAGEFEVRR